MSDRTVEEIIQAFENGEELSVEEMDKLEQEGQYEELFPNRLSGANDD